MFETHSLILIRLRTNHLKPCPLKKTVALKVLNYAQFLF